MCLTSGKHIVRYQWTALPAPKEVIQRINSIGTHQNMPSKITYANHRGDKIEDTLMEFERNAGDDTDDESYAPSLDEHSDSDLSDDYDDKSSHGDTQSSSQDSQDDDDGPGYGSTESTVTNRLRD